MVSGGGILASSRHLGAEGGRVRSARSRAARYGGLCVAVLTLELLSSCGGSRAEVSPLETSPASRPPVTITTTTTTTTTSTTTARTPPSSPATPTTESAPNTTTGSTGSTGSTESTWVPEQPAPTTSEFDPPRFLPSSGTEDGSWSRMGPSAYSPTSPSYVQIFAHDSGVGYILVDTIALGLGEVSGTELDDIGPWSVLRPYGSVGLHLSAGDIEVYLGTSDSGVDLAALAASLGSRQDGRGGWDLTVPVGYELLTEGYERISSASGALTEDADGIIAEFEVFTQTPYMMWPSTSEHRFVDTNLGPALIFGNQVAAAAIVVLIEPEVYLRVGLRTGTSDELVAFVNDLRHVSDTEWFATTVPLLLGDCRSLFC